LLSDCSIRYRIVKEPTLNPSNTLSYYNSLFQRYFWKTYYFIHQSQTTLSLGSNKSFFQLSYYSLSSVYGCRDNGTETYWRNPTPRLKGIKIRTWHFLRHIEDNCVS
jgi:hypothetical protein